MELFDTKGNKLSVNNLQQPVSIFLSNNNSTDEPNDLRGTLTPQGNVALYRITVKDENSSLYFDINTTKLQRNSSFFLRLQKSGAPIAESYNRRWNGSSTGFQTVIQMNGSGVYFLSLSINFTQAKDNLLNSSALEASYNIHVIVVRCLFRSKNSGLWSTQGCQVSILCKIVKTD